MCNRLARRGSRAVGTPRVLLRRTVTAPHTAVPPAVHPVDGERAGLVIRRRGYPAVAEAGQNQAAPPARRTVICRAAMPVDFYRWRSLLGKSPYALPAVLLDSGPLPRLPDTLYVGSPDQLVRRRPDVLQAERLYAARSLFVGAARAEYLPRVSLGARVGYTSTTVDSLFKRGNSRLLIGPSVSFPLFDIGRVRERVEIAAAGQEEAQASYNATVLNALAESQAALVSYD